MTSSPPPCPSASFAGAAPPRDALAHGCNLQNLEQRRDAYALPRPAGDLVVVEGGELRERLSSIMQAQDALKTPGLDRAAAEKWDRGASAALRPGNRPDLLLADGTSRVVAPHRLRRRCRCLRPHLVRIAHLRPGAVPEWDEPSAASWLPPRLTVVRIFVDGRGLAHAATSLFPRPVQTVCGRSADGWRRSHRGQGLDCPACFQALGNPAGWVLLQQLSSPESSDA